MKFKNFSISNKFSLISLTLVILVAAITALSVYSYDYIEHAYQKVKDNSVPDMIAIFETKNACRRSFLSVKQFLATGDNNNINSFKANLDQLQLWLSKYEKHNTNADIRNSNIKDMLLAHKKDIQTSANIIFADYRQRANLLEELERINKNLENSFRNRLESIKPERHSAFGNAIIEAKNLYTDTIALIADQSEPTEQSQEKKIEKAKTYLQVCSNRLDEFPDIQNSIQKLIENSSHATELNRKILAEGKKLQQYETNVINALTRAIILESDKLYHRTANVDSLIVTSQDTLIVLSAAFTAFALIVSHCFAKKIIMSISRLVESTKIMAKGDLSHRTQKSSNDEIGDLADSFNKMAEELQKQTAWVDSLNKEMLERRSTEEMLTQANQQLAASNHELMMLTQKLEETNRELKDFVYIASHDLREPLRKITSFGSILKESLENKLSGDDLENLKFMIDGANRMTKMIEGLLTYSRVSSKEAPLEEIDLNETVEELKQVELAKLLEETNATIEVPAPLPKLLANTSQIRQLLQNLISNGIKYRSKEAKPHIIIRAKQTDAGEIIIEVQDNGIGIEDKYFEDIFKMFRRLHSRREYEGTGIGLAICKKIVEKHNGKIGVESKPGQGSTFWFALPDKNTIKQEQPELVSITQG